MHKNNRSEIDYLILLIFNTKCITKIALV